MRKIEKDVFCIYVNRYISEIILGKNFFNFVDLNYLKRKLFFEGNEKGNSIFFSGVFFFSLTENCDLLSFSGENRSMVYFFESIIDESGLNKFKIRYEEF